MFAMLQSLLLICIELLGCKMFFEGFVKKREGIWVHILQFIIAEAVLFVVVQYFAANPVVKEAIVVCILTMVMFWYFGIGVLKSFYLTVVYVGVVVFVDFLSFTANAKLFVNDSIIDANYESQGMLIVLLGKGVLILCIFIIRNVFRKKMTGVVQNVEWIKYLFFPIATIFMVVTMVSEFRYIESRVQADVLVAIAFGLIAMNIVLYYLIDDLVKKNEQIYESQMFQLQAKHQTEMYHSMSESLNRQREKTHEYKNQIICIETLLSEKKYKELHAYVKTVYGELIVRTDVINTNNILINAVLNAKYWEAVAREIVFSFCVNDLSDICLSDEDSIVLLSNLLANAIEACEKCLGEKRIWMEFRKESEHLIIYVKNTFEHELIYSCGELITTKNNKEEHGMGIKNIIRVVGKYNGLYSFSQNNGIFSFLIEI